MWLHEIWRTDCWCICTQANYEKDIRQLTGRLTNENREVIEPSSGCCAHDPSEEKSGCKNEWAFYSAGGLSIRHGAITAQM